MTLTAAARRAHARRRQGLWILFLLAPALLVMTLFVAWPLLSALRYAFFSFKGVAPDSFVGLRNFADVLIEEPFASWTWRALRHNIIVFAALMVVQNGLAYLIAFALLKGLPGHRIHQVIVFLPVVLSAVIVGFLWKLFLHPLFGMVNAALALVGLPGRPWLGDESTALGSLIFTNAWHWVGFPALIFLAGMQRIQKETLEAARIDGATDRVLLTRIIWPLVAPATTIIFTLAKPALVTLSLLAADGSTQAQPFSGQLPSGPQQVTWDGNGPAGRLPDGTYVAQITADDGSGAIVQQAQVVVDSVAPALALVSGPQLRFSLTESAAVTVIVDGKQTTQVAGPGEFQLPLPAVPPTQVSAVAVDAAGNSSSTISWP